jgi:hypothetical protein
MEYECGDVGGCMMGRLQTWKTQTYSAETEAVVLLKC